MRTDDNSRITGLDSLRGLAALAVVNMHVLSLWQWMYTNTLSRGLTWLNIFQYSPLNLLYDGREAVIFFFLLSGFVLYRPGLDPDWRGFIGRRLIRLYLPFTGALIFALVLSLVSHSYPGPGLNSWAYKQMLHPITWRDILQNVAMIAPFNETSINAVFWSLSIEIRMIPIILVLCRLARRLYAPQFVFLALALFVANFAIDSIYAPKYINGWADTLQYSAVFLLGMGLAKYRARLIMPKARSRMIAIFGALLISFKWGLLPFNIVWYSPTWACLSVSIGASCILVWGLQREGNSVLLSRPLRFMGRISYSLYLVHLPILFLVVRLALIHRGIVFCELATYPIAIVCAVIFHFAIERPCIKLSRHVTFSPARKLADNIA